MLTIIIPVYNAEKTIEECIDSIVAADKKFPNLISEVIAVDDGSTDNSLEKLNKQSSYYRKLTVLSQENTGAGGARNKGITSSKTKFISFIDSDDLVHEDYLSPLINKKENDIISFNILKKSKSKSESIIKPGPLSGPMVSAFFRRSIFIDNHLFFPEGINYEDNAISFLVWTLKKNSRVHINKELYIYQYNHSSQSNTRSLNHLKSRISSISYLQSKAKSLGLFEQYNYELGEIAFSLAYIPALSLCFRGFSNYSIYARTKDQLSRLHIIKPENTSFKKNLFCFCIEQLGYLGYLLICLKRINKLYR
ncbi:glycosyltransferase family A protein [Vibrio jasicida]|uniref:glycosyltransferase family A protein n=1 Tax=Vibrio jasicida TaxID=766224 RepID=UPI000B3226AA|nr:glycosyltransferase family A protein [Vibrio jasicida]